MVENKAMAGGPAGFLPNKWTGPRIQALSAIIGERNQRRAPTHPVFLDIAKAYDSVEFWAIDRTLGPEGFDERTIQIIASIWAQNKASVITMAGNTEAFAVQRGVPQGNPISPLLFLLFIDPGLPWIHFQGKGVQLCDLKVSSLDYADDRAIVTASKVTRQINRARLIEFTFF